VDAGVAAALERVRVVLLLPVVRQRLPRNLPPRNPAAIGERRHEERVHRRLLENVEHRDNALVDKRNGPHLDADHLINSGRRRV